jgi:hypothetical protein
MTLRVLQVLWNEDVVAPDCGLRYSSYLTKSVAARATTEAVSDLPSRADYLMQSCLGEVDFHPAKKLEELEE